MKLIEYKKGKLFKYENNEKYSLETASLKHANQFKKKILITYIFFFLGISEQSAVLYF